MNKPSFNHLKQEILNKHQWKNTYWIISINSRDVKKKTMDVALLCFSGNYPKENRLFQSFWGKKVNQLLAAALWRYTIHNSTSEMVPLLFSVDNTASLISQKNFEFWFVWPQNSFPVFLSVCKITQKRKITTPAFSKCCSLSVSYNQKV